MAPDKRVSVKLKNIEKNLKLKEKCTKMKNLPSEAVSIFDLERIFGVSFKVNIQFFLLQNTID